MADSKITALTAISTVDPTADPLVIVDVSDTSMAASGTTKKSTINQLLGAGGTATLASATITGAATVGTTLSVTGVSTFAAGTALLPALTTTGDTNTGIYYPAADTFAVTTGGTERYRVDSSGNVGIGVTPPSGNSAGLGVGTLGSSRQLQLSMFGSYARLREWDATNTVALVTNINVDNGIDNNAISSWKVQFGAGLDVFRVQRAVAGSSTFSTLATLDASGNLSVGAAAALNSVRIFAERSGGSVAGFNRTTSDGTNVLFYRQGSIVGDVSVTTTGTTFNSTSDYRLKEDVQPLVGGLARVSALKPSIYKWKSNGSSGEGFLAHELAEVVPAAVSGEKDAVNEDGSIKAQSIDMSRVVPILVAAIQELAARVQTLETR